MHPNVLQDLLNPLYDGLLCPESWTDFLAEISKLLDCGTAVITFHDPENQTPSIGCSVGMSQNAAKEWEDYYGRKHPMALEAVQTTLRNGYWIGARSLRKSPVSQQESEYGQWMQRCDVFHSMFMAVPSGTGVTTLSLARPRSAKPFPQSGLNLMRQLLPHMQRVFQIHSRNETLRTLFEAEKFALDKLDTAVVAVDEQGRVVLTNKPAEAVLEKERGVTIHHGRLAARYSFEASHLECLVKSAAMTGSGRDQGSGGVIAIHGGDLASPPLSVIVTPFCSNHIFAKGRPCALAFIYDPAAKPASRAAALRTLFGLTPAECRLAGLLHEGLELGATAENLGVTAATARFMLKSIFRKTGLHRQSQLIQLLDRLPGEDSHSGGSAHEIVALPG